jgi:hypothetical protein
MADEKTIKKVDSDIEPVEEQPVQTLDFFGSASPINVIKKAKEIADTCSKIIIETKLFTEIKGKKYVHCEGWTTMGAMLGLFSHIIDVEDLSDPANEIKRYCAKAEIKTIDGRVVSKAESECSSDEGTRGKNKYGEDNKGKSEWEDYALRSMAETRAISKAMRICLGWIMKIANYEMTSAEEITPDMVKEEVKDFNGEVMEFDTELANAVIHKTKSYGLPENNIKETVKSFKMRQIQWMLDKKIKKGKTWFREKVKDIELLANESQLELAEIYSVLYSYCRFGTAIKKLKKEKKDDKKE